MRTRRLLIIGIIALLVAGAGTGLYFFFKPIKDFAASTPDIIISAGDLLNEFSKDEASAIQRFVAGDKTIQVSGRVDEMSVSKDGTDSIILSAPGSTGSVMCSLMPGTFPSLHRGEDVAIKGQCTGMQALIDPQVIMIRCVVVKE